MRCVRLVGAGPGTFKMLINMILSHEFIFIREMRGVGVRAF